MLPPDDINSYIDTLVSEQVTDAEADSGVQPIHPDIWFKLNSVNLVIGKRGSGKTYNTLREILKLPLLLGEQNPYTQVHYVTDKYDDDTVSKFKPLFDDKGLFFNWCSTENAFTVIDAVSRLKHVLRESKNTDNPEALPEPDFVDTAREVLHCKDERIPHTCVIFDDCMGLFAKESVLSKRLFENRQARITYFLLLQDTKGISTTMKSNVNSLVLFGGFAPQKFNYLFYQVQALDLTYDDYASLDTRQAVCIDFNDNTVRFFNL